MKEFFINVVFKINYIQLHTAVSQPVSINLKALLNNIKAEIMETKMTKLVNNTILSEKKNRFWSHFNVLHQYTRVPFNQISFR